MNDTVRKTKRYWDDKKQNVSAVTNKTYWLCRWETASGRGERININIPPTGMQIGEIVVDKTNNYVNTEFKDITLIEGDKRALKYFPKVGNNSKINNVFESREDCIEYYNLLIKQDQESMERLAKNMLDTAKSWNKFRYVNGQAPDSSKPKKSKSNIKI